MTLKILLKGGTVATFGTMLKVHKDDLKYYVKKYPNCWITA